MNQNSGQVSDQKTPSFNTYVGMTLVVGLVIGFIVGNLSAGKNAVVKNNANSSLYGNSTTTGDSAMTGNMLKGSDSASSGLSMGNASGDWLDVLDQPAGHYVTIAKLNLDKPYWIAVRDSAEAVKNPYILGAKHVQKENYKDVQIYVPRATVSGQTYDIVFYKDAPTFNYDSTNLVKNGSEILRASFKAN